MALDLPRMRGPTAPAAFRLGDEERIDWLRLIRTENVGPRTFRALLRHYGSARSALTALPELARRGGAKRIARVPPREEAERELKAMHALDIGLVGLGEPDYPRALGMLDDAPPLIAVRGKLVLCSARCLPSSARAMPRPPGSRSPAGSRASSAWQVLPSSRASLAASTRRRTGQVYRPDRRGARRRPGSCLSARACGSLGIDPRRRRRPH